MIKRLVARVCTTLVFVGALFIGGGCVNYFTAVVGSTAPTLPIDPGDLAGTWSAQYQTREDRLVICSDGRFKQVHISRWQSYTWESPWNEWWLDYREDGNVWLHLEGGRYYVTGVSLGEQEGMLCSNDDCSRVRPRAFFDPFSDASLVRMVGELILVVRRTQSGQMILLHMCTSQDGCGYNHFSRTGS